jgi:hypothetical protein
VEERTLETSQTQAKPTRLKSVMFLIGFKAESRSSPLPSYTGPAHSNHSSNAEWYCRRLNTCVSPASIVFLSTRPEWLDLHEVLDSHEYALEHHRTELGDSQRCCNRHTRVEAKIRFNRAYTRWIQLTRTYWTQAK